MRKTKRMSREKTDIDKTCLVCDEEENDEDGVSVRRGRQ